MPVKINIFGRVLILVVALLIPILALYGVSNRIAGRVVGEQIRTSGLNQLTFFLHQLDGAIESLSMFPVILGLDPHIRAYLDKSMGELPEQLELPELLAERERITGKLGLQSVSSPWSNDLSVVVPSRASVLSSNIYLNGSSSWPWDGEVRAVWTYEEDATRGYPTGSFIREIAEPAYAKRVRQAAALFQVRFPVQNITGMLDVYKKDKEGDPFLYKPGYAPIRSSTPDVGTMEAIIGTIGGMALRDSGQERVGVGERELLVSYVRSAQLDGWYMIDYAPVDRVLAPIRQTSSLFYLSVGLLLALSTLASFLLYRNVQIPIVRIVRSMQRLQLGDLTARIGFRSGNEFDYLIRRFNEMAEQIQALVEDVYAEKIRSREATLKQLQSQINPHFLYNSLFFVINSAMMDDRDSVVAMAQHLAEYYRYTTRVDDQTVTLKDELELLRHYLEIQNMRMQRIEYAISVPESMMGEKVPRLLIQPLVENAVVHGIERRAQGGRIVISGERGETYNRIVVEDNGVGLMGKELHGLIASLRQPMTERIGRGTWNVHQRLYYRFGEGSGLTFSEAPGGGLRAILTWNRGRGESLPGPAEQAAEKEGENDRSDADRR